MIDPLFVNAAGYLTWLTKVVKVANSADNLAYFSDKNHSLAVVAIVSKHGIGKRVIIQSDHQKLR